MELPLRRRRDGDPYLLFTCADVACAAPLAHFREVLPTLPTTVALPFSPPWMLGFFALHTELIGLVRSSAVPVRVTRVGEYLTRTNPQRAKYSAWLGVSRRRKLAAGRA